MNHARLLSIALLSALFTLPALAHEFQYTAILTGASEIPPSGSPATGTVLLTTDLDVVTLRIEASFTNLTGPVTAAHIHGRTAIPLTGSAGVAILNPSLPSFPLGVTSGAYDQTIDLTSASAYTPEFITASGGTVSDALNSLLFGLDEGRFYFNIETTNNPSGEISGFLTLAPEPTSLSLLLAPTLLLLARRRRHAHRVPHEIPHESPV